MHIQPFNMHIPDQAIWLYRQLTAGGRRHRMESLRAQKRMPVAILFYHRVATTNTDNPWSISRDNFRLHLDWLQENFEMISLREAQSRIRQPENDSMAVSITFDDGYRGNADNAIAELVERKIPATYFVSTSFIQSGNPFPHDAALGKPLAPNTIDQLRDFLRLGIEIGAHTQTHSNVGAITDPAVLRTEIVGSIETLRDWLAVPIRYFAFPYGLPQNMSQSAVDLLVEQGIDGFCSAYGAFNWPGDQGTHLRRIHADAGIERLKNWLTLDRRKLDDTAVLPFVESSLPVGLPFSMTIPQ